MHKLKITCNNGDSESDAPVYLTEPNRNLKIKKCDHKQSRLNKQKTKGKDDKLKELPVILTSQESQIRRLAV
jgi:hypothetical protein